MGGVRVAEQQPVGPRNAWPGLPSPVRSLEPEPAPEPEGLSLVDVAGLTAIGVGIPALCGGVAWAAGPGWGLATFGAILISLGVLLGLASS